eukprot:351652-Chlamydomonas_euryale.AAC.1
MHAWWPPAARSQALASLISRPDEEALLQPAARACCLPACMPACLPACMNSCVCGAARCGMHQVPTPCIGWQRSRRTCALRLHHGCAQPSHRGRCGAPQRLSLIHI